MKVEIDEIKLGTRIREDLGDLTSLQASIMKMGLLTPIIITPDKKLLAGARRLTACKNLGWVEIEAVVIEVENPLQKLEIETHENIMRKEFTPEELDKILEIKKKLMHPGLLTRVMDGIKMLLKVIIAWVKQLFRKSEG